MFEKEIELRALLCGKETQFCYNSQALSQALRPDIMWCVANCSIMCKILSIYAAGRRDEIKIEEEDELPEPPETDLYRYKNEESI